MSIPEAHQHHQNPYGSGSAYPPPPPPVAQPARRRRTALIAVASAVTGAVVGAGFAAPVAWVVAENTSLGPSVQDELIQGAEAPGQREGVTPERGSGQAPGFPGTSNRASFEDATAEEATGVMLIEVSAEGSNGAGTGWVVDDSGLVVTNYHVVSGSSEITATGSDGESYEAEVVGHDAAADVALLQLDGAEDLTEVTLDDDGDPAVGDDVTAVGNAAGQGFLSASDGDVMSLEEDIRTTNPVTGATTPLTGLIQTDARVVQGFSGGVLIDDEGEVVGITSAASAGGPAQSFAVPIEDALDVIEQIRADDESGSVQIGPGAHVGISVAGAGQLQVAEVQEDSPAAGAGITAGSVITGLDGQQLGDFADLEATLAEFEPGDTVTIAWTDASGAEQQASITLAESPRN